MNRRTLVLSLLLCLTITLPLLAAVSIQRETIDTGTPYVHMEKLDLATVGPVLAAGLGQPTALASGDFDGDGMADIAVGYASGKIVIYRGNIDSIFPNSKDAQERKKNGTFLDSPFYAAGRAILAPEAVRFLAAGDFNNDGHDDLVAAGSSKLYLMAGDGATHFAAAVSRDMHGTITALSAGDVNRRDGLMDLVVGVHFTRGSWLKVLEGPAGAFSAAQESLSVPVDATSIAIGRLSDGPYVDIAAAAGSQVVIVSGRDRKITMDSKAQSKVPSAAVTRQSFSGAVKSVAIGDFLGDMHPHIAVLTDSGYYVMSPSKGAWASKLMPPQSATASGIVKAHVSSKAEDSAVLLDGPNYSLNIAGQTDASVTLRGSGAPIAVLPMRLNADAIDDLVAVYSDSPAPKVLLSAPVNVYLVNDGDDHNDGACEGTITGDCTLREAILAANASPGADFIGFDYQASQTFVNNNGDGPLPVITEAVTIDGTTVSGYLIGLDTGNAPCDTNANQCPMFILAGGGGSVVRGILMSQASQFNLSNDDGIQVFSANNIVEANQITKVGRHGVFIAGVPNNTVGGSTTASRNWFSDNGLNDVYITGGTATGNVVSANYLGLATDGVSPFGPGKSNILIVGASGNTIGGTTNQKRNYLTDAGEAGMLINFGSTGNLVQGNYIGTNGTFDIGSASHGIEILNAPGNTIGGTAAGSRNVISGNDARGIYITSFSNEAAGNVVQGNYIGLAANGLDPLGNSDEGILADAPDTLIGGAVAGAGNVISANGFNSFVSGIVTDTSHNEITGIVIQGNLIGTNKYGKAPLPLGNASNGILSYANTQIGGTTAAEGNIVAVNGGNGIQVDGDMNAIQGNFVGTNPTGDIEMGNQVSGIVVNGQNNVIGGDVTGAGNVVSSNVDAGIVLQADDNVVQGNIVGLSPDGTSSLGNGQSGIVLNGASFNHIGGTAPAARNVISGNGNDGIEINGMTNLIEGNYIGTNGAGDAAVGNTTNGVEVVTGTQNQIGSADAGNVISGNLASGLSINDSGTTITNNHIGTDAAGTAAVANGTIGVYLGMTADSSSVVNNVISGNTLIGLEILSITNSVRGNRIGTNSSGTAAVGNSFGVLIYNNDNTLGGANPEDQNTISGNVNDGITVDGGVNGPLSGITIQNNHIGVDAAGTAALGNGGIGIFLTNGMTGTMILGNVVSGNANQGVNVGLGCDGTSIAGNFVGTDLTGTAAIPNGTGIRLNASGTTIGGATPAQANVISGNSTYGVLVAGGTSNAIQNNAIGLDPSGSVAVGNLQAGISVTGATTVVAIIDNRIDNNGGLGIDLNDDGITANDGGDGDTGPNSLQNFPALTSAKSTGGTVNLLGSLDSNLANDHIIQVFKSSTCNGLTLPTSNGEGAKMLESFTLTAGNTAINRNYPSANVAIGEFISATATDVATGETSEFSNCVQVSPPSQFVINDVQITEGDTGTQNLVFTISLSPAVALGSNVSVIYTANPGTAISPDDFLPTTGTATILAGQTFTTINVPIVGDTLDETAETFTVDLTSPSGTTILDPQGVGTILDNDLFLFDDFADSVVTWTGTGVQETGGALVVAPNISAFAPLPWPDSGLSGCSNCEIEANLQNAGGPKNQVILTGWFNGNTDKVEVIMKEEADKWQIRQTFGSTIIKKTFKAPINANQTYNVQVSFDGTNFVVSVDGIQIMTMAKASGSNPNGNVGFRAKKTTGTLEDIKVRRF